MKVRSLGILAVLAGAFSLSAFNGLKPDIADEVFRKLSSRDESVKDVLKGCDGYIHGDITRAVLKPLGFTQKVIEHVTAVNWKVDVDDLTILRGGIKPTKVYRAGHHFDRSRKMTHVEAWKGGRDYVWKERETLKQRLTSQLAPDAPAAMEALGAILHSLQDFCSHSNFVELSAADQEAIRAAFLDPSKEPPATIRITGFDINGDDDFDDFGHKAFHHDTPDRKNHKEAVSAATKLCTDFWKAIEADLKTREVIERIKTGGCLCKDPCCAIYLFLYRK